jgi:hypothetical protein
MIRLVIIISIIIIIFNIVVLNIIVLIIMILIILTNCSTWLSYAENICQDRLRTEWLLETGGQPATKGQ